jgi:hypothetical protein
MLPALTASPPAASGAGVVDGTWRAELIPNSGQAGLCPYPFLFVADLTVIFRRDAASIPYPPVLFDNNSLFLGSARVSAAGYSHGWTWTGVCLLQKSGYEPPPINFCDCSASLMPATANDSKFALYMACSVSYANYVSACLGAYTFSPVNASSID